ncbi:hypothetical protein [Microvirga sp. TS319]|uniref:hypothetical protein n=1 Tax=Microvirga sp. TS319 TaxID=3241165 RepID=UPI003519DC8E
MLRKTRSTFSHDALASRKATEKTAAISRDGLFFALEGEQNLFRASILTGSECLLHLFDEASFFAKNRFPLLRTML